MTEMVGLKSNFMERREREWEKTKASYESDGMNKELLQRQKLNYIRLNTKSLWKLYVLLIHT